MNETEVKQKAFGMPLTNPSYPKGPYRFINREYLITAHLIQAYSPLFSGA
jgi:acetoacetate decarboxylase